MFRAIIIISLIASIPASGILSAAEISPYVSEQARTAIEVSIEKHEGWKRGDYHLWMMHPWDNDRIPVVLAMNDKLKTHHEPAYAILKDGAPVSYRDPRAFEKILEDYFSTIAPADAAMLAELSLMFGVYPKYLGYLWKHRIDDKGYRNLSRKDSTVRFRTKGPSCIMEFYSLNSGHKVNDFYDCTLIVTGTRFKLTSRKLKK